MSRSLNNCMFIGNLGSDPETRTMPANGDSVCSFSIAVSDDYKKDGNKIESTEWVRVVAFGPVGDICGKFLKKGSKVFVSGKFKTRSFEKDGHKVYSTEIVLKDMQMLDSRQSGAPADAAPGSTHQSAVPAPAGSFDNFDDDLPF